MPQISRKKLVDLLQKHNAPSSFCSACLSLDEVITGIRQQKVKLPEGFFKDLAGQLGLPFVERKEAFKNKRYVFVFPLSLQKEHVFIPLDIKKNKVRIATANPLDPQLKELDVFKNKEVEICVTDLQSIEDVQREGYREVHKGRAMNELFYRTPEESACTVLNRGQIYFFIAVFFVFAGFFTYSYPLSFIVLFALLNIAYFVVNPLKFYIALRGLAKDKRSVSITEKEVADLNEADLPVYTILVPLYKEAKVLPHIMKNVHALDYPKNKLDVKLLLEEDDKMTRAAAERYGLFGKIEEPLEGMTAEEHRKLLQIFDPVIVPLDKVKTKPRACNFGLYSAKGKYCVIYDAEDDPEADQLKKAVVAFERSPEDVICLQAHLSFYNPNENILTQWFALEYAYWFDVYLEGLCKLRAPLPLGGTSNHFRTAMLRDAGGWDPFNVTEDADLGIRLSKKNYRTMMFNSFTYEEANSKLWNWIRQRSRWIKGYLQTYLVHMRHPFRLLREMGLKWFLLFQLSFGGNFLLTLVNPILYFVTIATLLFPGSFQFLFSRPIAYVCMINLFIGNSVYILLHMIPPIKNRQYLQIFSALLLPIYWVLMSFAAWKGVLQLIFKPFYWEKTEHGLSSRFKTKVKAKVVS